MPLEAEVNDADPQEFNVIHDPEHPNIVKGALFRNIVTFRKAIRQCLDVDIEVQNQALALDGLEFGCLDGLDISPWNRTTIPRDIWPPLREPAYNTEPSRSEFGWNRVFPPPTARTPSLALVKNKSYCLSRGTEGTP